MKTYISFDCDSKPLAIGGELKKAQETIRCNLVIETDNQFHPMKVINAWALVAHANSSPYWMATDSKWALESLVSGLLYSSIHSETISAKVA